VDLDFFDASTISRSKFRKEIEVANDVPLVAHLGKFIPAKGQDILIKAIPSVLAHFPRAHFVLMGGAVPDQQSYYEELMALRSQLGLAEHLSILGYRRDVREVIQAADIVVNTSRFEEPFGRTLIEAMALYKPVIGPNHGGVPEIIVDGETGLLFAPHNYQHLAFSLSQLLSDTRTMQLMGKAGRERTERFFSLTSHANQIQSIYEEEVNRRGS
jgi:glycosyltransferase involved in cell wall biosynthesis